MTAPTEIDSEAATQSPNAVSAVLEAVASERGEPVGALTEPLYDVVDPDALDALFTQGQGYIRFEYAGTVVTVDHEHTVTVAAVA